MVLIDSIKKSFKCIVDNPSITLFLVLFLIGANLLASSILSAQAKLIAQALIFCLFALVFIFFSGWFEVIKETCQTEKIKEKNFYSIFLEGVGKNIISSVLGIALYIVFVFITIFLAQLTALNFFGDINFFLEDLNKMAIENSNFVEYFNNLNINQKYIIYGWNICIIAGVAIFNFLSLFYFPALINNKKNAFLRPFIAIWEGLKFLFKNFFNAIGISIFIYMLNAILAFLNAGFAKNSILSVVFLLIYIYFISYVVMLIFYYYEAKNNCPDRCNSLGENETVNSISEET